MKASVRKRFGMATVLLALMVGLAVYAAQGGLSDDHQPSTATHDQTGNLTFLGTPPASPITLQDALQGGLSTQERGLVFLTEYGEDFGLADPDQELNQTKAGDGPDGRTSVRYQQVHEGVPRGFEPLCAKQPASGWLRQLY